MTRKSVKLTSAGSLEYSMMQETNSAGIKIEQKLVLVTEPQTISSVMANMLPYLCQHVIAQLNSCIFF